MNTSLLFLLIAGALLGVGVFRLWRSYNALTNEMRSVKTAMTAFGNDIAGLCLAEVRQDDKLNDARERLHLLEERLNDLKYSDKSSQTFHAAIVAARKGADAALLVEEYGLNRGAAELLVRLHGL